MILLDKDKNFIEKWNSIREQGRANYFWKITIRIFIVVLILLVVKDFIVHPLDLTIVKIGDIIFKNLFISFGISAFLASQKWKRNEIRYKKLSS